MDKCYLIKSKLDVHWGTLMQTIPNTKIKFMLVHNKAPIYNRGDYQKIFQLLNSSACKYFTIWVHGKVPSIKYISWKAWFFFLLEYVYVASLTSRLLHLVSNSSKIWARKAENIQLKCTRADINNQTLTPKKCISMQLNFCVQQNATCLDFPFLPSLGSFAVTVRSRSSWRWLCSVSWTNFTFSTFLESDSSLCFQYIEKFS